MDHRRGKDPTPQGREPELAPTHEGTPAADPESVKYEHSAPGPEVRKDGVYFYGYKRENASPKEPTEV